MTEVRLFGRILAKKIEAKQRAEAELATLKRIWEGSPNYGMGALLEAFDLCMDNGLPLPPWLARAVRAELMRPASKQALKHYRRWREVRSMRDTRPVKLDTAKMRPGRSYPAHDVPHREISYEETLQLAEERFRTTSAAGSAKAIRRSYELVERDLPERERYQRTHMKRSR